MEVLRTIQTQFLVRTILTNQLGQPDSTYAHCIEVTQRGKGYTNPIPSLDNTTLTSQLPYYLQNQHIPYTYIYPLVQSF